jgi:RsiW-degrading membrane proteinase PrsW (M82 family)
MRFRYAVERRQWGAAASLCWRAAWETHFSIGTIGLALISGLAWLVFCLRLARAQERALFRIPLAVAACVLGGLSIVPTDALIAIQESVLHLTPNGEPARDALFYLFGVGFREELSKLLLFAPLVPFLRWGRATRLDVLVAGALVGLGFASVENLQYFARGDLGNAMARFLTANFLHMAMTGLTAAAFWEAAQEPDKYMYEASKTFLTVVAIHGGYDFFLSAPGGLSYLSMVVFFILTQKFTTQADAVRGRVGRGPSLLDVFVIGMVTIAGTSFVYASAMVGPRLAAATILQGMVGLAIIAFFFVQELRRL